MKESIIRFIEWWSWQNFEYPDKREIARTAFLAGYHAAEQRVQADVAKCRCGGEYYTDKVFGEVCCRCQAPRN